MTDTDYNGLIDTHAHLDEPSLAGELQSLLHAASENQLTKIITIGTTLESSRNSLQLAKEHPMISAAVGIHPNYSTEATDEQWAEIIQLAKHSQVVAVGETGLDRYWDYAPIKRQIDYFHRHIELSRDVDKPFIVHCRDAEQDILEVLAEQAKKGEFKGVMHSFCGSWETATCCLDWGMYFSFSGMLTFKKNTGLRELAAKIPINRVMVETDSPYLAPVPFRGKRNQPAYVKHTAEVLAECYSVSFEEICHITTANAQEFFKEDS